MKKYLFALLLALAASPAPAAVFREDISTEISSYQYFPVSFAPFNTQLGQLEGETILLSGTASMNYGAGPAGFGVYFTQSLGDLAQAAEFSFYGDPRAIPVAIDWSFPAFTLGLDAFWTETMTNFNRVVNYTPLTGEVEYFYTPNASTVPEASTWAMLLCGFALIGAMGWRRSRKNRLARTFCTEVRGSEAGSMGYWIAGAQVRRLPGGGVRGSTST